MGVEDIAGITCPPGLELRLDDAGLTLVGEGMELRGDFTRLLPRLRADRVRSELLVKAARIRGAESPRVIDATAGLGEDSLLLAAAGFCVELYERDAVIAALLRDALRRAANDPQLTGIVERMTLHEEDSVSALRNLSEAPDVVLLGEMRDPETVATAMTAAEMAQLLFSTLHTTSASGTVDRIVDTFPAVQQHQIRIQLSLVLQAIVCQQLVPTVDGKVTPVFEIMKSNPAIRNLIRERKTHQIDSVIAAGGADGMRTMDQSLFALAKQGRITAETAMRFSIHEEALERHLELEGLLK